ncbi:hypothetical protein Tco_0154467 [Tanacetum coccineum]
MQPKQNFYNLQPAAPVESVHEKKYYSIPDISGLLLNREPKILPDRDGAARHGTLKEPRQSNYDGPLYRSGSILGSEWLFKQNGGLDEDLIDRIAARERFMYELDSNEASRMGLGEMKMDEDMGYLVSHPVIGRNTRMQHNDQSYHKIQNREI